MRSGIRDWDWGFRISDAGLAIGILQVNPPARPAVQALHEPFHVRRPPGDPQPRPESPLRDGGDSVAGARDWGKYRDIHPDRPDRAAEAAGGGTRAARDAVPAGQP